MFYVVFYFIRAMEKIERTDEENLARKQTLATFLQEEGSGFVRVCWYRWYTTMNNQIKNTKKQQQYARVYSPRNCACKPCSELHDDVVPQKLINLEKRIKRYAYGKLASSKST